MPSLRQIRSKISSVKGTRRIMSAMKLIAAVKLQRAQSMLQAFRPYSDAYAEIVKNLALRCDPEAHPLLRRPEEKKKLHLVFMTSDRGLCGSYNTGLIRRIETYLAVEVKSYEEIGFRFIGRRGRDYFSRRKVKTETKELKVTNSFVGINEKNFSKIAEEISTELVKEFVKGESDEVVLVYTRFKSALSQIITFEKILPIEPEPLKDEETPVDYLYEPNKKDVLRTVLPKYIQIRLERAILESITSEHGARMTAMENATNNASGVIKRLTLLFNKTRQAMITKELMDIVNGTESLKKGD